MNVLVVLIPVSLSLAGIALCCFIWSVRQNQYDDLEGDAFRILNDDDIAE